MEKKFMYVDDIAVELNGEKNVLEVIRKAGIDMPTLCYHPELSIYGACRMCMFENERGGLDAACSAQPRAGMKVYTNTERLRKYRKNIIELLLANHCRDCNTCEKNGNCKLQQLAKRYDVRTVRFPNTAKTDVDDSSVSITRDASKCILCGQCVRMCNEIQSVGAIHYAHRGSHMLISTAFERPIAETVCVGCGQCAAVCPVGAITIKQDTAKVWKAIADKNLVVTAQVAPAVRVAIGKELNMPEGTDVMANSLPQCIAWVSTRYTTHPSVPTSPSLKKPQNLLNISAKIPECPCSLPAAPAGFSLQRRSIPKSCPISPPANPRCRCFPRSSSSSRRIAKRNISTSP